MAYSTTKPPRLALPPGLYMGGTASATETEGGKLYTYVSTDTLATVIAAGYITNPQDLGMKLNDIVLVIDTTTPAAAFARVSAISATSTTMVGLTTAA